jgi:hypothetical protein
MIPLHIAQKLGQYILVALSTDKTGEAAAAMAAARRALDGEKISIHEFADTIKNPTGNPAANNGKTYTQHDLSSAYERGRTDERRAHEAGMQQSSDGDVTLAAMARFLTENIYEVADRHHGFIHDMAVKLARCHRITEKQQSYLESLYFQAGGQYRA